MRYFELDFARVYRVGKMFASITICKIISYTRNKKLQVEIQYTFIDCEKASNIFN